jgi:hypothetical protein
VPNHNKASAQKSKAKPLRQSVTIPPPLAAEVRRVASERRLSVSRALVSLAERGVRAERDARENLRTSYLRFVREKDPSKKDEAGKNMIRAIFGEDGVAEDTVL